MSSKTKIVVMQSKCKKESLDPVLVDFSQKAITEALCTFPNSLAPGKKDCWLSPPCLSHGTTELDQWWQTTLQLEDDSLVSRHHLPLPKVPWYKGQRMPVTVSKIHATWLINIIPRQRNTTVSNGREREQLLTAECPALSPNEAQPSLPPSQIPAFSPFNAHSFSTLLQSDKKFPARGHCSNGLLKRNAIPCSRQTSSFSPWGRRIIAWPEKKKEKTTNQASPKPAVIILNKRL